MQAKNITLDSILKRRGKAFPVLLGRDHGIRSNEGGSRVSFCFRPRFKDYAEEIDSQRTDVEDRKKLLDRIYDNSKQGNRPLCPLLSARETDVSRETAIEVYIKGRMKSHAGSAPLYVRINMQISNNTGYWKS